MELRRLKDVKDLNGKKVLVRVDFNVELDVLQNTGEHFKLGVVKETLDYLAAQGVGKIALLTHLGRPNGRRDEAYSVQAIVGDVERRLGKKIRFVADCVGEEVARAVDDLVRDEILLLENVRFYPGEEANDEDFAKRLVAPFDLFVNEAFSVCHRAHASIVGVTRCIESCAGFRLTEEIVHLETLRTNPSRPAVAVIGGAKIETKLPIIRNFEKIYDAVLVGGKIANEAIDQQVAFGENVLLPQDFQNERFDIGPMTSAQFSQVIKMAKTIVWNGPMGKFEEKPYDLGTKIVLHAIMENKEAFVVIGGGESLVVVDQAGVIENIGFVSTGGGAMLEFLGDGYMPGLDVLKA